MSELTIRRAERGDVAAIAALLADDEIGAGRESPDLAPYDTAFALVDSDPSELLVVAEHGGQVVGTLQLSFLPGLSRGGALRAQIEGVRIASGARDGGWGGELIRWAVEVARERGCVFVQLTTDNRREDAQRFYTRLGFEPSHTGFKLSL